MGNGAMAKGPQATAPILDSTTTDISARSLSMIGRQTGFHIMFDAAACRPRSEQWRGSVAVADGWASRNDQHG